MKTHIGEIRMGHRELEVLKFVAQTMKKGKDFPVPVSVKSAKKIQEDDYLVTILYTNIEDVFNAGIRTRTFSCPEESETNEESYYRTWLGARMEEFDDDEYYSNKKAV